MTEVVEIDNRDRVFLRVTCAKVSSGRRQVFFDRAPHPPFAPTYVPSEFSVLSEKIAGLLASQTPYVATSAGPDA